MGVSMEGSTAAWWELALDVSTILSDTFIVNGVQIISTINSVQMTPNASQKAHLKIIPIGEQQHIAGNHRRRLRP